VDGEHQLNALHAVDRTMVQLQRNRECTLWYSGDGVESLDDRDLPRRTAKVDLPCVNPRDLDAELAPVAGLGQRDVADVVLKVEVWVIHPVGHVQTAGQLGQPSPAGGREMQPGVEFGEDAGEGHLAGRSGRWVIDEKHLNLHRRVRPFGAKHHVISPAQLLHARLLSPPNLATG
jgi:hypothetical protein